MSDEFSTIRSFWSAEEAQLARIQLEMRGIHAHLEDETLVGMAWIEANAVRGAKLLVRSSDAERAKQILDSEPQTELTDDELQSQAIEATDADGIINLGNSMDEVNPEQPESTGGVLTAMRSLKSPVIWGFLAPTVFGVLSIFSTVFGRLIEIIFSPLFK
jgi:hypothetical protein